MTGSTAISTASCRGTRAVRRGRRRKVAVIAAATTLLVLPAVANARDDVVTSFDGEPLITSFFPAKDLAPGERAPTVLVGHGWGGPRDNDPESRSEELFGSVGVGALREAGFNVLSWDARGFGGSGGTVQVDAPDAEARDVQELLTYVARQPEAQRDGRRDPRVGMSGASYGGGIQLNTAAIDRRVDALVPDIAWHSLLTSLYKEETVKAGWGSILYGAGVPTAFAPGLVSPAGLQSGNLDPHITSAFTGGLATGRFSDEDRRFFETRGPGRLIEEIRAPTLIVQGTVDTLFTLDEAETNYRILRRNGVPVKMLWFCGGHGACFTDPGEEGVVEQATIAWFDRYLNGDRSADTGPRFRWLADDGAWRSAGGYPLERRGSLEGDGSGMLPLVAGASSSGAAIAAAPSPNGVNTAISAPAGDVELVGQPKLRLTYSGTAAPERTVVYAQIVDRDRNLVLGNQVTPIPLLLDGQEHTVKRPLEAIAAHATPDSSYEVQVVAGSNVYDLQRSTGAVELSSIHAQLPVTRPKSSTGSQTPPDRSGPDDDGSKPRSEARCRFNRHCR